MPYSDRHAFLEMKFQENASAGEEVTIFFIYKCISKIPLVTVIK